HPFRRARLRPRLRARERAVAMARPHGGSRQGRGGAAPPPVGVTMAPPPPPSRTRNSEDRPPDPVGFLLRVAMQRHTAIFMSRIVKGLTQTQFAAIAKLREVGPCSQNQLGRLIYLDAATTKGVVDRLEARGFVTARPDARDRRRRA